MSIINSHESILILTVIYWHFLCGILCLGSNPPLPSSTYKKKITIPTNFASKYLTRIIKSKFSMRFILKIFINESNYK